MDVKINLILGDRLLTVAEFVREGACLCDVGTDHAKLPIYLALEGKIKKGIATDINEGPINSAKKNVSLLGLSDKIECIKTDGLAGTEGSGVTDVSICGMGGELIARILSECDYIRDNNVNLILQPMSRVQELRKFLYDSGFDVIGEKLTCETGKLYVVINARYKGVPICYDDIDLLLGKGYINRSQEPLFDVMVDRVLYHLKNKFKSNDENEVRKAKNLYEQICNASRKSNMQ